MPSAVTAGNDSNGTSDAVTAYSELCVFLPCYCAEESNSEGVQRAVRAPVETVTALVCLQTAGVPLSWLRLCPLHLTTERPLCTDNSNQLQQFGRVDGVWIVVPASVRVLSSSEELPAPITTVRLPAAWKPSRSLCVAGLCSVVRCCVRQLQLLNNPDASHYHERDCSLLGFRRGSLAPPAEFSPWTAFVERLWPEAVSVVVRAAGRQREQDGSSTDDGQNVSWPLPELMRFEHHLRRPLRVHNVWKQEQNAASRQKSRRQSEAPDETGVSAAGDGSDRFSKVQSQRSLISGWRAGDHLVQGNLRHIHHEFAEGHVITIADLLLFPCIYILRMVCGDRGEMLAKAAPTVAAWMSRLESHMPNLLAVCRRLLDVHHNVAIQGCNNVFLDSIAADSEAALFEPAVTSLYRKDGRGRRRLVPNHIQSQLDDIVGRLTAASENSCWPRMTPHPGSGQLQLSWNQLPVAADPSAGQLPAARAERKRQQLQSMMWIIERLMAPGHVLVDFCSGGGHLGLLAAVLLRHNNCRVVLLENKHESIARAERRLSSLGLQERVTLVQCNMAAYHGRFSVGVALHACGLATDQVIERCVSVGAAFVVCPCCYGSIGDGADGLVSFPRSRVFSSVLSLDEWLTMSHAADRTHSNNNSGKCVQGGLCMQLVDQDRLLRAAESGYRVLLTRAEPAECSPKNQLLVGVPPQWSRSVDQLFLHSS